MPSRSARPPGAGAPLRAPAGVQLVEARVQLAAGLARRPARAWQRRRCRRAREERSRASPSPVYWKTTPRWASMTSVISVQVLADQVARYCVSVEHPGEVREAAHVDGDHRDLVRVRDQHAGCARVRSGLLQRRGAGMVGGGRDGARAPADDGRGRSGRASGGFRRQPGARCDGGIVEARRSAGEVRASTSHRRPGTGPPAVRRHRPAPGPSCRG